MNKILKSTIAAVVLFFSTGVFASEYITPPVDVTYIAKISKASGHKEGNFEIGVSGLNSIPGKSCSPTTFTTLDTVAGSAQMFSLIETAMINNKKVILGVTDAPEKSAFSGRCSITLVNVKR